MSKRRLLSINRAEAPFFVGVDLGGTNVKVGVVDDRGRPMSFVTRSTEAKLGALPATRNMADAVGQAIEEAGLKPYDIAHVGLGSPGTMDIPKGKLINPVNLKGPGWQNFSIRDRLSKLCGLKVAFENDANAAAYGEFWVGAGRKFKSLVLFTLGTGIGSGIFLGDLSVQGEHSHGGECGHLIIDHHADARRCGCGKTGHLEAYASATAVVRRTREELDAGRDSQINARIAAGEKLTPKLIGACAEAGDALALDIIRDTACYLAVGVVNVMHTVDPSGVLLGGAMTFGGKGSKLGRRFLDWVRKEVRRRAFPTLARETAIEFAELGGDAGFIGAAGIARLVHRRQ